MNSREVYFNFFFMVVGVIITVAYFDSCNPTPKPGTVTETRIDTTIVTVAVPQIEGKALGKIKYVYLHGKTDTVTERIYITTERGDTIKSFIATLDTIDNKDTVKLSFTYPQNQFSYWISRTPLSVPVVSSTTTKTVFIQPRKLTIGIQAGAGFVQPLGGAAGVGAYGGIGIGYTLY